MKHYYNLARIPSLYFWRDNHGNEVDAVIEKGEQLIPVEIKAGKTVTQDYFTGLAYYNTLSKTDPINNIIIFGGKEKQKRSKGQVYPWNDAGTIIKNLYS